MNNLSEKEHLIQNSLKYINNETIIEISSQRKTKQFSVIDSDALSFVNLTYNKRLDRYIASCEDGYCKSQKRIKKNGFVCLFVWCLTTHQPLWVISVKRY